MKTPLLTTLISDLHYSGGGTFFKVGGTSACL